MTIEKITDAVIDRRTSAAPSSCVCCRSPKADCSMCVDACHAAAITVDSAGPKIGPDCDDCGVCYAVCPTGAFGIRQGEDEEIMARAGDGRDTWSVSCRYGNGDVDLVLSCLGRLTETILLTPLSGDNGTRVEIARPDCDGCRMARAMNGFDDLMTRVAALCAMNGMAPDGSVSVRTLPRKVTACRETAPNEVSRRDFLGGVRKKSMRVAASALPDTPEKKSPAAWIVPEKLVNRKRTALLNILRRLSQKKTTTTPAMVSAAVAPNALLSVGADCMACGVCAMVCPSGALFIHEKTKEHFTLSFRADLCINCGLCGKICMPQAIRRNDMIDLNRLLDATAVDLFSAAWKTCRNCGFEFVGDALDGICPLCVDRHKRQQNTLKMMFAQQEST